MVSPVPGAPGTMYEQPLKVKEVGLGLLRGMTTEPCPVYGELNRLESGSTYAPIQYNQPVSL